MGRDSPHKLFRVKIKEYEHAVPAPDNEDEDAENSVKDLQTEFREDIMLHEIQTYKYLKMR